jgi:hypothetical protein
LQTDDFRLFLHQQMDKQQTSVCAMSKENAKAKKSKELRKIAWASVFHFQYDFFS